jgi:hypothetical protein
VTPPGDGCADAVDESTAIEAADTSGAIETPAAIMRARSEWRERSGRNSTA